MEIFLLCFLFSLLSFQSSLPGSIAQLSPSETRILFQIRQKLEYPQVLQGWNNWTNFCYLPPSPSLVIVCSDNHITELTVTGNITSPAHIPQPSVSHQTLSDRFSIDSFFTVLTKLSSLKVLSLVSLGLWGPLPEKINRLRSLEVLNISSNFIYGEIPPIASLKNLKSLVLADNLINGSVPDLRGLQALEELNLGYNHLGPKFPQLGDNLVTIILRNNSLRSDIPTGIDRFDLLQQLDISANKLVGPLPSSLFSLLSIQSLNLADNQFSGALPVNLSCNSKLKFVEISRNLLTGKMPACIGSNSKNRTVLSWWNCLASGGSRYQHPYKFCHKEALAVKPPEVRDQEGKSSIKLGLIFGIIGGIVGAAGALGLLILLVLRRAERKRANGFKCENFVSEKNSVHSSPVVHGRHTRRNTRLPALGLPPYHVFTLEDMEDATNNFDPSNLVGEGSQGQLYKGWLRDGSMVLVKRLKLKQKNSYQNLKQHMEVISKLRHRHLVSVLGHCIVTYQDHPHTASSTVFIVLEHVANGSLREHLTDWRRKEYLKWPQRMGISVGIARGIQFLHTGIAPGIFGNDLKIDSILLDESLAAKISSYNISLPSKVGSESPLNGRDTSNLVGSIGDPEKNDIYQLGEILLEVITGKPITSESELDDLKLQIETTLAESPSRLKEEIDPSIRGTFAYESLKTAVEITMKCLCKESSSRPTIEDVLWHLQYSIQVQEGWTSSGNLSTKL